MTSIHFALAMPHMKCNNEVSSSVLCEEVLCFLHRCRYTASSRYMRMGYEEEFLTCLQALIGEVEKKIRRGHARLALNQTHSNVGF